MLDTLAFVDAFVPPAIACVTMTAWRYLFRQLLFPCAFASLVLTGVLWLSQSLRFVDLIVNKGLPAIRFFQLTLLLLPSMMLVIVPFGLLISTIFVVRRLGADNELTVLKAAGFSHFHLAGPFLALALGLSGLQYLNTLYLLPISYTAFKDMEFVLRNDASSLLLQEQVFNHPARGLTVYVQDRDQEGFLRGVLVHDERDAQIEVTMTARRGQVVRGDAGPSFVLLDGSRQETTRATGETQILYFGSYQFDAALMSGGRDARNLRKTQERFIGELLDPPPGTDEEERREFFAEGHKRLSWPLAPVTLTLITLAALLPLSGERMQNRRMVTLSFLAGIGVFVGNLMLTSAVSAAPALVWTLYLLHLVPITLALLLLLRASRRQRPILAPA